MDVDQDAAAALEIEGEDVIRLMMQFCKEQGLAKSLAALQEETGVSLNIVEDGESLQRDILNGQWDRVMEAVAGFALPNSLQALLMEQVVAELAEARETEAAKTLMRSSLPLLLLKREDPPRYARLERLVAKPIWDAKEFYGESSSKETRRNEILKVLTAQLWQVPPSRLLTLLGQAMKWQQATHGLPSSSPSSASGAKFDLFRGSVPLRRDVEEQPCVTPVSVSVSAGCSAVGGVALPADIKFPSTAYPLACEISPDGSSLVAGCVDGIIECYSADTGKLRMDLPYQADDSFMLHDDACLAMAISRPDGELLATGSRDGQVKVWRLKTGECLRKFTSPHAASSSSADLPSGAATRAGGGGGGSAAVTALAFSSDGAQLITGGVDGVVKVHGLRSGKTLKEYRGHSGTITSIAVGGSDGGAASGGEGAGTANVFFSSSADGTVRVWDGRNTGECLAVIRLPNPQQQQGGSVGGGGLAGDPAILSVQVIPRTPDHLLIVPRGSTAYITTSRGAFLKALTLPALSFTQLAAFKKRQQEKTSSSSSSSSSSASAATPSPSFVCATCSPQGKFIYCVAEDRSLHIFSARTGALEASIGREEEGGTGAGAGTGAGIGDVLALIHHPLRNLLVSYGPDGILRFWQPNPLMMAAGGGAGGSAAAASSIFA